MYLVACGTSYHACLTGRHYLETIALKGTKVGLASEFAYMYPLIKDNTYFIFLSQSGETADCIKAMHWCKQHNYPILAIVNTMESTMCNLADDSICLLAGKEVSIAATKSYTSELAVLAILAASISEKPIRMKEELDKIADAIEIVLSQKEIIQSISKELKDAKDVFFLGRGIDYYTALEGALKLKETAYVHSEGYASGEFKHGPMALINKGTPIIGIITQEKTSEIMRSNLLDYASKGAKVYSIASANLTIAIDCFAIPIVNEFLSPIVSGVVMQLLAYYVSLANNLDIDQPRNLVKSVTIE